MDYRAIDFLGNFDDESRKRIIEFGKRISSDTLLADVYLVMARKAICFIDALSEFRLVNIRGKLVTDRILDMNTGWLKGKSVSIIDDALVSGTTLRKTIEKLEKAEVSSIKVFVLSINEKWFNPEMLTKDNGETYLVKPQHYDTNEKCLRMCYDIVKALSTVPKPYDIDYPLYGEFKISPQQLNKMLNSSWSAFNVTSSSHISHSYANKKINPQNVISEFESITFLPPEAILERLAERIGINFTNSCVLKVRSYVRRRTKKAPTYSITLLPFAIFNEIYENDLDRIIKQIFPSDCEQKIIDRELTTYESKFRVVQFFVATQLMKLFYLDMGFYSGIDSDSKQYNIELPILSRINYIFTSPIVELLHNAIKRKCTYTTVLEICSPIELDLSPGVKISNNEDFNCISLTNILSKKFYALYIEKELKARVLAREHGKGVFTPIAYQDTMKRLEEGYSFHDLCMLPNNKQIDAEYVSIFLDYAIDTGIAVPITYSRNGRVVRAYRHGEDVIFTIVEEKLLSYMLYSFLESSGRDDIPALLMEKLLTTFIRFGLHDGIFEKYDYKRIHAQTCDFVKIAYNLHGSTARVVRNDMINSSRAIITTDTQALWLRDVLVHNKLLAMRPGRVKDQPTYYIDESIQSKLIEEHESSESGKIAKRIAHVLGFLYSENAISEKDLILLNASFGHDQIIPALLAEVAIIQDRYTTFSHFLLERYDDPHAMNWIVGFRRDRFFTAQNSGFMKLASYYRDEPRNIIQRIQENRKGDIRTDYFYDEFERYWFEKTENMKEEVSDDVERIIKSAAIYILQYGLIYRVFEYMIFKKHIGYKGIIDFFSGLDYELKKDEPSKDIIAMKINAYQNRRENTGVVAYLRRCDVALKGNLICDTEKIREIAEGSILKADIETYIQWICQLDPVSNILKSKSIVDMARRSLLDESSIGIESYLKHLEYINKRANSLIDTGCKYINFHGEIERPISFSNLIILQVSDAMMRESLFNHLEKEVRTRQSSIRKKSNVELQYQVFDNEFIIMTRGPRSDEALLNLACYIEIAFNQNKSLEIYTILDLNGQYAPYRFESCITAINITPFLTYFHELKNAIPTRKSHFVVISESGSLSASGYDNDLVRKLKEVTIPNGQLPSQTGRSYYVNYLGEGEIISMSKGFTIGVICAKTNERAGVIQAIKESFGVTVTPELDLEENKRLIDKGTIIRDGVEHTLIITKCDQGNHSAANAYSSLAHFKPDYIVFVGIAGTCNKNIMLGDVVLPKEILDATLKKEKNDEFQLRGTTYQIPGNHVGIIDLFLRRVNEMNLPFNLFNSSLVSDNTVYACDDSQILRSVLTFNDKVDAIEMESAGIYKADYELNKTKYGVFTIRGISDNANSIKDDSYHDLAIKNASTILCEFLNHLFLHQDEIVA